MIQVFASSGLTHRHSATPNTGLCNLGESHPLLCWANHLRRKGNSLCLPQPALQQKLSDLLPHTPQQKHTSSGKPMELEANAEGSASAAAALLKLPCELSSPLCCSEEPALPSNSSATLPLSATRQTTCPTPHTSCSSDLTQQHSSSRSKCHNWWHDHNTRQNSGHATLGETYFTRRKILQRKPEYSKLCFWLKPHVTDHTGVEQAKCYKKKFSRSGLGEPKRAG